MSTPGPRMSIAWPVVRGVEERSRSVILGLGEVVEMEGLKEERRVRQRASVVPAMPAPDIRMLRGCSLVIVKEPGVDLISY